MQLATADQSNDAAFVEDGGGVRCSDSSPSLSYHIRHGSDLVERVSNLTAPFGVNGLRERPVDLLSNQSCGEHDSAVSVEHMILEPNLCDEVDPIG